MRPVGVVGSLTLDVVDGVSRVGGPPYYAAQALALLGRPARIVARCAAGDRDRLVRPLVALGVPVSWRASGGTPAFAYRYVGEERVMAIEAVPEPWTPADVAGWVADALGPARWVHVGAVAASEFPPETLAALARGRRLLLDGQGLVRVPRVGPLEVESRFDGALLRHVSVLKLAREEAAVLAPELDAPALGALGVAEVLVTLGSEGCLVYADGRLERVAPAPLPRPVDPTGAGDAFAAAYLTYRNGGERPAAAARRATALVRALLAAR